MGFIVGFPLDEVKERHTTLPPTKNVKIDGSTLGVFFMSPTIRVLCFRKQPREITAEFHKVTLVKPFIDCWISGHSTLTGNEYKLVDTVYTIFPYISAKISRRWQD